MKRLKKLIARVRETVHVYRNWIRSEWEWAKHCHALEAANHRRDDDKRPPSAEKIFVDGMIFCVRQIVLAHTVCRVRGHKLEDAGSYAGPESAVEDLECSRCGWSFHHVYYSLAPLFTIEVLL